MTWEIRPIEELGPLPEEAYRTTCDFRDATQRAAGTISALLVRLPSVPEPDHFDVVCEAGDALAECRESFQAALKSTLDQVPDFYDGDDAAEKADLSQRSFEAVGEAWQAMSQAQQSYRALWRLYMLWPDEGEEEVMTV